MKFYKQLLTEAVFLSSLSWWNRWGIHFGIVSLDQSYRNFMIDYNNTSIYFNMNFNMM